MDLATLMAQVSQARQDPAATAAMVEQLAADDPAAAAAERSSPVAKAKVSPAARRQAINRRTEDGQPVHSFRTLLRDLANLTRNTVRFGDARPTTILSRPTQTHNRAFDLLGLKIAA